MKESIENWLIEMSNSEIIPNKIEAINFGLFESQETYILYLIGSEFYDEKDDEWAALEVNFEPKNKYLELPDSIDVDWEIVQNNVIEIISKFISSEDFQNSIFRKIQHITVGFDDGDLIKI